MAEKIRYYVWRANDVMPYYFMVAKMSFLLGPENVRVEFHPKARGCKNPDLDGLPIHRVINALTGEVCGEYDVIGTCPPTCE